MSTPSTASALQPPHQLFSHQSHFSSTRPSHRPSHLSFNASARSTYSGYESPRESRHPAMAPAKPKPSSQNSAAKQRQASQARPTKAQKKSTDWNEFFKNGVPKEVIVIDDSSPEASKNDNTSERTVAHQRPADKKRRTNATSHYDPVYNNTKPFHNVPFQDDSTSTSAGSSARTASAFYSTAPTSLTSQSSGGPKVQKLDDTRAGQKRKRQARPPSEEETPEVEFVTQNQTWTTYVPPPQPPQKSGEVHVKVVADKTSMSSQRIDDDDGHYVVTQDTALTDRYHIVRLLGQGTFGKVVEAYDREKRKRCAVKIIRAVQKYRDASKIELRVLKTLAINDTHNRNRCIHLRDAFDFRHHICIVTDLLGSSVFDFLKLNQFTPFPSSHIQSFARQLFTSVAFLHDLNLIHTDLKPENILLVGNAYQTFTYNRRIPSSTKQSDRSSKYRKVLLDPEIRLIDFGSATFEDEYHSSVVSTRHYRAPEIILNLGWSFPCDIWSIGCILVEFFTGDALFQTHDNLEHLALMEAVCESKIEKEMIQQVRVNSKNNSKNIASSFFPPRAYRLDYPTPDTPRASRRYVKNMKSLSDTIPQGTEFNRQFLDLLQRIFVYDPKKRITAKQALSHPWFRESMQDDGTEALKIRLNKERERTHSY